MSSSSRTDREEEQVEDNTAPVLSGQSLRGKQSFMTTFLKEHLFIPTLTDYLLGVGRPRKAVENPTEKPDDLEGQTMTERSKLEELDQPCQTESSAGKPSDIDGQTSNEQSRQKDNTPTTENPKDEQNDEDQYEHDDFVDNELDNVGSISSVFSKWRSTIVHINGSLLEGYFFEHLRRLGDSITPGLITEVQVTSGLHTQNTATLRVAIRDGNRPYTLAQMIIPMGLTRDAMTEDKIDTTNLPVMTGLFPLRNHDDMTGLIVPQKKSNKYATLFDDVELPVPEDDAVAGHYIHAYAPSILRYSISLPLKQLIITYPTAFWKNTLIYPEALRKKANGFRAIMNAMDPEENIAIWITLPNKESIVQLWRPLTTNDRKVSPYVDLTHLVRLGKPEDLDYGNVILDGIEREFDNHPPAHVYIDNAHRTVALIAGAVDEIAWQEHLAAKCEEVVFAARIFALPTSHWVPTEDDMTVYGIEADGQAQAAIMFVELEGVRDIMPPIGAKVKVYLDLPQIYRVLPDLQLTTEQIRTVAAQLMDTLDMAEFKAEDAERAAQEKLQKLLDRDDEDGTDQQAIEDLQEYVRVVRNETYLRIATEQIFLFVGKPRSDTVEAYPEAPRDLQIFIDAREYAIQLRQGEKEGKATFSRRLETWIQERKIIQRAPLALPMGEAYMGHRLNLPPGVCADVAMLCVFVPRQSNWAFGYRQPPLKIKIPTIPLPTNLQAGLATMFNEKNVHQLVRAKIYYDVDDKSNRLECAAINTMNNLSADSPEAAWWTFILQCDMFPERFCRNLLEEFPLLEEQIRLGAFHDEQDEAVRSLRKTKAGKVFFSGVPGAGKSSLLAKIAGSVVGGPHREPHYIPVHPPTGAGETGDVSDAGISAKVEKVAVCTTANDQRPNAPKAETKGDVARLPAMKAELIEELNARSDDQNDPFQGIPQSVRKAAAEHARESAKAIAIQKRMQKIQPELPHEGENKNIQAEETYEKEQTNKPNANAVARAERRADDWGLAMTYGLALPKEGGPSSQRVEKQNEVQVHSSSDQLNSQSSGKQKDAQVNFSINQNIGNDQPNSRAICNQADKENGKVHWDQDPEIDNGSGWDGLEFTVKPGQEAVEVKDAHSSGKVAWIAPQNSQVDDAFLKLRKECPEKKILRVYPFIRELENVMNPDTKFTIPFGDNEANTDVDKLVLSTYIQFRTARFQEKNPACDKNSWSEQARCMVEAIAKEPSVVIRTILDAWEARQGNSAEWIRGKRSYYEAGRALLQEVLDEADIICCTPVAFAQLANHCVWKPSLIIIDEAGKLTEAMTILPVSKYPKAATIFIGDGKQFGPLALASEDREYKALFTQQRQRSLLARMENNGALDFMLVNNHRAHGTVHNWPNVYFYKDSMNVVNNGSRMTNTLRAFVRQELERASYNEGRPIAGMMFVNLTNSPEARVGTSYINEGSARFTVEFARHLAAKAPIWDSKSFMKRSHDKLYPRGKILIITPYLQQKNLLLKLLAELSPAEAPAGMISVRTADDSQGHEAEVVIVCLVRTSGLGFIAVAARLAVMTTRAIVMTFLVGDTNVTAKWGGNNMAQMLDYLANRNAIINVGDWTLWCDRCYKAGHVRTTCQSKPKCLMCEAHGQNGLHAARDCPFANLHIADPLVSVPIQDWDDVQRDIFDNSKPEKSQSRKKVKIQRQKRKQTNQGTTSQMRTVMKDLSRQYTRLQVLVPDVQPMDDLNLKTDAQPGTKSGITSQCAQDKALQTLSWARLVEFYGINFKPDGLDTFDGPEIEEIKDEEVGVEIQIKQDMRVLEVARDFGEWDGLQKIEGAPAHIQDHIYAWNEFVGIPSGTYDGTATPKTSDALDNPDATDGLSASSKYPIEPLSANLDVIDVTDATNQTNQTDAPRREMTSVPPTNAMDMQVCAEDADPVWGDNIDTSHSSW